MLVNNNNNTCHVQQLSICAIKSQSGSVSNGIINKSFMNKLLLICFLQYQKQHVALCMSSNAQKGLCEAMDCEKLGLAPSITKIAPAQMT